MKPIVEHEILRTEYTCDVIPCYGKCAICKQSMWYEHPESIREINPLTFRKAWMHSFCFQSAYDDLASQPASGTEYDNKQDEYNSKYS